jgi:predicted anti-sigma-YlaC factor YlaD
MLDCQQALFELSNYVDDEVTLELKRAIEEHLAGCCRCWVVYDTTRRMLRIVTENRPPAAPLAVIERLHARLLHLYAANN